MLEKQGQAESGSKEKEMSARLLGSLRSRKPSFKWFHILFDSQPTAGDYGLLTTGALAAIAAGVPFPLLGIIFGQLIDDLNSSTCQSSTSRSTLTSSVKSRVLEIVYISVANFILIYLYTTCWSLFGERLARRIRRDYFRSLVKQDAAFFDTLVSGDVTSRLVTDLETVQTGTSEKVGIFIASLSYFVAAYVVAFLKASKITGILVSLVPAYILMAMLGGHYTTKYTKKISVHIEAATSVAASCLSNIPLVHALGAQERLTGLFADHLSKTKNDVLRKALSHSVQLGLLYFIAYSSNALAFWEGSREIAASIGSESAGVTVGAIYTVIFVLLDASFIVSQVAPFIHIFHAAGSASERLEATIYRKPIIDGTVVGGMEDFSLAKDDIQFRNVSFSYPGRSDRTALEHIDFRVSAGKTIAIVGPSGSGKSTLTALLERLYDPDEGSILVGETDLRNLNVRELRRKIGFVEQSAPLLNRSILENVAYGLLGTPSLGQLNPESQHLHMLLSRLVETITNGTSEFEAIASSKPEVVQLVTRVRSALEMAHASEFVQRLPAGIATNVGPSASQISGGQRQRIALARALIREPEILILDEATASLDSTSERLIKSAISEASKERTVITIAHRLASIQQADNIVVINNGRIVEQGDHQTLLEKQGEYARMVKAQNIVQRPSRAPKSSDTDLSSASSSTLSLSSPAKPHSVNLLKQHHLGEKPHGIDQPEESNKVGFRSILRPYWLYILIGLIGSIVVGGSYTGEAALFGQTMGRLNSCHTPHSVLQSGKLFGLLFFVLGVIEFVAMVTNGSAFGLGAAKTLFGIRVSAFRSLLKQPLRWHISEGRTPGILLSIITSDASALSNLTGATISLVASTSVNMAAGIIFAHIIAWKIAIVLLATVPILLAAGAMRLRVLSQFHERHQKQFAKSAAITLEAVENIRVVASLSLEETMYEEFNDTLRLAYQETLKAVLHSSVWLALSFSIPNLVYALGYWWGSQQIIAGTYSQTQFFTVLPALLFSTQSCGQLFAFAPDISKAKKAKSNVLELISIDPDTRRREVSKVEDVEKDANVVAEYGASLEEKPPSAIGLSFDNVRFAYPTRPDTPVLRGLSFAVAPGQFCALVGWSGEGKSTIFNLIERFYVPKRGSIIVDHSNITYQTSTAFRSLISLVPQSSVLFHGTLSFNLGLGAHPDRVATQSDIENACRLVGVHELIASLPEGYETVITSNSQLSGGQRQRICIARALVRRPSLLLLDESTSALDTESERQIKESLVRVRRETGITLLAIAHRLNTIMEADRIFWIERGICEYSGRHDELMVQCPGYRECVEHQKL